MRIGLVAILAATLMSCSTLPTEQQRLLIEQRWQTQLSSLQDLKNWRASGRIAVSTPDDGGNASLLWTQRGDDFVLRLNAAFGRGTLQISKDLSGARLVSPSGEVFTGGSADELLYQNLGWHVPIEQLRQWLTGRPGNTSDYTIGRNGLLESARLDGWTVKIQKYNDDIQPTMPMRMSLYRDEIKIRIVIDGWNRRARDIETVRIPLPESATK